MYYLFIYLFIYIYIYLIYWGGGGNVNYELKCIIPKGLCNNYCYIARIKETIWTWDSYGAKLLGLYMNALTLIQLE